MTISEELANLRTGQPGCDAVVFADLSTGMVLAASTAERTTQEKLDALCNEARAYLTGSRVVTLSSKNDPESDLAPDAAWLADADGLRCFLLAPAPAKEAMCLVLSDAEILETFSAHARQVLLRITAET